jgi:hypothetical protein
VVSRETENTNYIILVWPDRNSDPQNSTQNTKTKNIYPKVNSGGPLWCLSFIHLRILIIKLFLIRSSVFVIWIWIQLNPTKTGGELRCFWRVGSSCSTSGTRRVTLVANSESVISHEWGKDREVLMTCGEHLSGFTDSDHQTLLNSFKCFRYLNLNST